MKISKKFLVFSFIILLSIFCFTSSFATDNGMLEATANNVRNAVGGFENTVKDAALDISNGSKAITGGIENNFDRNKMTTNTNSNSYTATRTNADTNVMGMSSTAWTWIIIAIAAIAIIAVIWYYSMQVSNTSNHNNDNDDD